MCVFVCVCVCVHVHASVCACVRVRVFFFHDSNVFEQPEYETAHWTLWTVPLVRKVDVFTHHQEINSS